MPRWMKLSAMPVGTTALLPVRLAAKSGAGATFTVLDRGDAGAITDNGTITVATPSKVVTGAWTGDPAEQRLQVVALALAVGDVVEGPDGTTAVVRWVGTAPDGQTVWSPAVGTRPQYPAEGWQVIASVTLP